MSHISRRRLIGVGTLLIASHTARAATGDRARFRDEVVALLRAKHPAVRIVLDDDPLRFQAETFTITLDNLYARTASMPVEQRRREIATFLDGVMPGGPLGRGAKQASPERFAQARTRLLMQIVPKAYFEQAPSLVVRAFSRDLLVSYALDEANRYQLVTQSQLDGWGVTVDALEEPARTNSETDASQVEIQVSPTESAGRFATAATEDGYAAARILLPNFMARLRRRLDSPRIIVAVPVRDVLIAWTPDSAARSRLAQVVRSYYKKGPYSRSEELFVNDANGTQPLSDAALHDHGR